MASTSQKLNLDKQNNLPAVNQARDHVHNVPKRLPVSVVSIDKTNSIITLKFETDGKPYTLPNVTVPLTGPEYIRYPIAVGDKGFVTSADSNIGNMSGLGPSTPANFSLPANLSPLIFTPMGNTNWVKTDDQTAVVKYGPTGTVSRDTNKKTKHVVHPTSGVTTQTGAQGQTGPTSDPTYNITHAVHPKDGITATAKDSSNGDHFSSIVPQGGSGVLGILLSAFGGKHKHQLDDSGHTISTSANVNVSANTTNIKSPTNITGDTNILGNASISKVLSALGGMFGGGGGGISASGAVTGSSVASTGSISTPGVVTGAVLQNSSGFTVASLNATFPPAANFGMRSGVTDASGPTWNNTLVGGGGIGCSAYCNGATWVAS